MSIMIGAPIQRNRAWILGRYLNAIYELDYPKEDIHLSFLLNGQAQDRTQCELEIFCDHYQRKYKQIDILHLDDKHVDARDGNRDYSWFAAIRNLWLQMRIPEDDFVFSVDSDILLQKQTLNRLLAADKPIVSALIRNSERDIYPQFNIHRFSRDGGIIPLMPNELEGSVTKVDLTGAAVLIKKEVLDAGICYSGSKYGEDLPFCQMAEEKGFDRYVLLDEELEHIMRDD